MIKSEIRQAPIPFRKHTELPKISDQLSSRVKNLCSEAESLAQTLTRVSTQLQEVIDKGGIIKIQPQIEYITGSMARIQKDWGVIEHLQNLGVTQKAKFK